MRNSNKINDRKQSDKAVEVVVEESIKAYDVTVSYDDGEEMDVRVESVSKEDASKEAERWVRNHFPIIDNSVRVVAVKEGKGYDEIAIPRFGCPECTPDGNTQTNDPFLNDVMEYMTFIANNGHLVIYQKNCSLLANIERISMNGNCIQITISEKPCCKANCNVRIQDHD